MSLASAVRAAIEKLYTGTCDVIEHRPIEDGALTRYEDVTVLKGQPCRLSFGQSPAAGDVADGASPLTQTVKLFLAPEVKIMPGSKIIVTQAGQTVAFNQSGPPAFYESHQEISLELWKGWA